MARTVKGLPGVKPLLDQEAERVHKELSDWLTPEGEREVLNKALDLLANEEAKQ